MDAAVLRHDHGLGAVIGMSPVIQRLEVGVAEPMRAHRSGDLLARPPAGVVLYGPEGCGVRTIAAALRAELAPYGVVDCGDLDDGPLPPVLAWGTALSVGWSRRPWSLPPAAFEAGRIECLVFVAPPDAAARRFRIWELAVRHRVDPDAVDRIVVATEGWSGVDLEALFAAGGSADELVERAVGVRPRTRDWLEEARMEVDREPLRERADDLVTYLERYRLR